MPTWLRGSTEDKAATEAVVRASGFAFVIVRPAMLNDHAATGNVKVFQGHDTAHKITRADVAQFCVDQLTSDATRRRRGDDRQLVTGRRTMNVIELTAPSLDVLRSSDSRHARRRLDHDAFPAPVCESVAYRPDAGSFRAVRLTRLKRSVRIVRERSLHVSRVIALEEHAWTPQPSRRRLLKFGGDDTVTAFSNKDKTDQGLLEVGEERLARMDAAGVDFQVLSITAPGNRQLPPALAVPLARDANDFLAEGD